MMCVVARDVITLGPQPLEKRVSWPALEGEGAGFDALECLVTGHEGFVRFADLGVGGFVAAVEDC